MCEYVMVLDFKSAKYFPRRPKTEDVDHSPKKKTYADPHSNNINVRANTLWISNVCNALHVIFGHRPLPTMRKISRPLEYAWIPEITEVAKKARVRIDSVTQKQFKNGSVGPYTEVLAGTKPNGTITSGPSDKGCKKEIILNGESKSLVTIPLDWDRLRYYMKDAWADFVIAMNDVVGDYSKFGVYYVFSELNKYHNQFSDFNDACPNHREMPRAEVKEVLNKYYCENSDENITYLDRFFLKYYITPEKRVKTVGTPIYEIIINGNVKDQFINSSGFGDMESTFHKLILHSPEQVVNISGKIQVRITEDMKNRLKEYGRSFATILDGGVLSIESITEAEHFNELLHSRNMIPVQTEI